MVRKRTKFDPLANRIAPHWLTVCDMHGHVLEAEKLPAGTDLRAAMRQAAERRAAEGWQIETDISYGFFFCTRGPVRRLLCLSAIDPCETALYGASHLQRRSASDE